MEMAQLPPPSHHMTKDGLRDVIVVYEGEIVTAACVQQWYLTLNVTGMNADEGREMRLKAPGKASKRTLCSEGFSQTFKVNNGLSCSSQEKLLHMKSRTVSKFVIWQKKLVSKR